MKKLTPKEDEVLQYMLKVEKMNFAKSGKFGIFPNTRQIELVFDISRQRANYIINTIGEHLEKSLRQL
jgi:hypothetical protein